MNRNYRVFIVCIMVLFAAVHGLQAQVIDIDSNGYRLKKFLKGLGVVAKWQSGYDIDWETGVALSKVKTNNRTYCTRFVAAACKKGGVYTLHPLYQDDKFGANRLYDWLHTREARKAGWKCVEGDDVLSIYCQAQQYANKGMFVIVVYQDPLPRPGHSALVMPAITSYDEVRAMGPVLIQAGGNNTDSIRLIQGFHSRIRKWPEKKIRLYYNETMPVIE